MSTDLATLAALAEILGAAFVIGGVVFAIIQIRQFRRQRLEMHEWFQWLADQLEKRTQTEPAAPAYRAQRDWKS